MIWLTSDHHFYHGRILELQAETRPFGSIQEMNQAYVEIWNETVSDHDIVVHLGDLAMGPKDVSIPFTKQLKGNKVLVPGNHDGVFIENKKRDKYLPLYLDADWVITRRDDILPSFGYHITISHFPLEGLQVDERYANHLARWRHQDIHIHGHTHSSQQEVWRDGTLSMHVGVDAWYGNLVPLDYILAQYERGR